MLSIAKCCKFSTKGLTSWKLCQETILFILNSTETNPK